MSLESPFSVLFDSEGTELAVTASQSGSFLDGTQPGFLVMGSGSNGAQFLRLASDGALFITGQVTDTVDITGALLITGAVAQGDAGSIPESWYVRITDGTQVIGDSFSTPIFVTGSVLAELDGATFDGGALLVTGNLALDPNSVVVVSGNNYDADGNLLVALSGVAVFNEHLQVTGTVNVVEPVTVTGSVSTTPVKCPNTTVTGFDANTTSVTVLATNTARCGATFFMDGNSRAFIKLGTGASTTDFSILLRNNGYFELPASYTGEVSAVFNNNANNTLRITEITE